MNLSLNETLLILLLYVKQIRITQWVRGYLRLIRRDSCIHIHGITVYVKEGLHFEQDLFQENSPESYLCFRMALLHSVSNFFFLFR